MHEASLMANLMRRINEIAASEGAKRVVSVSVRLGALSHMSAAHFTEHFTHAAAGTIAAGARLEIKVAENAQEADAEDIVIESIEVET